MATQTTHYNLTKPDLTDLVDVTVLNGNADIIDQKIYEASQSGGSATAMIESSVEASATSAHAYAAGDHFIYNGTLYRATAAIAIGDTITPGTNCTAVTVAGELEGKVDKVTGKQLSTEDYTTAEKTKLSGIEAQANKTVIDSTLTQAGQAADAKAAGDAVSELRNTLNHKADLIYDTASGDIASFPDGADGLPVKDLTVSIEPVQSGTGDPSPTNVRPISGWTGANVTRAGKNLLKVLGTTQTLGGITFTVNDDGTVVANGTSTGWDSIYTNYGEVSLKANVPYRLVTLESVEAHYYCELLNGNTLLASTAYTHVYNFTVTKECTASLNIVAYFENTFTNEKISPMICPVSASDSSYEPPNVQTIPISFGSAGTVYGGTLDVTNGVLTVTDANIASYNGETLPGEWISDRDVYAAGTTPTTGAQVVYKLATPQTYQLTPTEVITLLGQNNIWADCGPSTVEYPADTKLYIQKINAPTDDDMVADANIASGKYFIINNNLYLSTTAILAGDPIKPGTNCTATNLAAALNAINT